MQLPLEDLAAESEASQSLKQNGQPLPVIWPTPESAKLKSTDPKYHQLYHQAHKAKWREYNKTEYARNHARYVVRRGTPEYKARQSQQAKVYRSKNKERFRLRNAKWHSEHKEHIAAYRKAYRQRRLELYAQQKQRICARKRELARTPKYRWRINGRFRERRKTDPQFALMDSMRASMNRAFRRNWIEKPYRTEAMFGCSIAELKSKIEQQFSEGMSWKHRASFVIDHFVPIKAFDLRDKEEALWAFNWRNLRPMTRHDNAVKSDSIPDPLPDWLPSHIAEHINSRRR